MTVAEKPRYIYASIPSMLAMNETDFIESYEAYIKCQQMRGLLTSTPLYFMRKMNIQIA